MANVTQFETGGTAYGIKDPISYKSITAFYGADTSLSVTYNYGTKVITLPAGFVMYQGRSMIRSAQQQLDLSSLLVSECCTFWVKSDSTIYAKGYTSAPDSTDDEFVGFVFRKNVCINGVPPWQIKVTDSSGNILSTADTVQGTYLGIKTTSYKVVYNQTANTLILPGGFKVYRGNSAAYSAETINLPANTSAFKLYMKNTKAIYAIAWDSNSIQNLDDDFIGYIYDKAVVINGIPPYCISILDGGEEDLGVNFGDAYIGINSSSEIVYDTVNHTITIPAGFCLYRGIGTGRSTATTLDVSGFNNDAGIIYLREGKTLYAKSWDSKVIESPLDEIVGTFWGTLIWVNGVQRERIRVVGTNGATIATAASMQGSFIGIELEIRKVVYNATDHTLTLPGGFKVYRGSSSAYTAETIELPTNTSAYKLWMQSDKTVYAKAWTDNTCNNLDDDCIGFIYGTTVVINGVPEACVSVINNGVEKLGVFYGDAYIGINSSQEIVYNTVSGTISIPAGFSVYRGMCKARSAVSVAVSGFAQDAGIIYMKNNYSFYARAWNSDVYEKPDDEIVGIIWGTNIWINGVDLSRISVITSNSGVYCFGDSITAGTGTTYAYHMYFHDWNRNAVLYNYGVGSTGFVYETSDTVTVGGGVVGIGSSHKENGNNSIKKVMQSVSATMNNIIIAAGTNDYGTSQPIATFRTAVQDALEYAISQTPNVLVLTPIKRNGWATTTNSQGLLLKDYVDVIIEECEARGIVYANGFDVGINPTNTSSKTAFAPDGLHPNAAGHRRMGRAYFAKFLEAVSV